MFILMPVIFVLGILAIALEDKIKINKAAIALFMAISMWMILMFDAYNIFVERSSTIFQEFLTQNPEMASLPPHEQFINFISNRAIVYHLGNVSETLFFVMCSMLIVDIVDKHGGFRAVTGYIRTPNKRKLLWYISFATFFFSALLDNLAAAIVIMAVLRKLVPDRTDRLKYACMVIIAANAGGSWSPIGDVTTILLWVGKNISAMHQISHVFIPALVNMLVPLTIAHVPTYSWVEYGTDTLNLKKARTIVDGQVICNGLHNKIRLTDLRPGQTYYYRVCSQEIMLYQAYKKEFGETAVSPFYTFKVPSASQKDFTALIFNDLHKHIPTLDALYGQVRDIPYDFVVFNGDCIDDPANEKEALYHLAYLCGKVGASHVPAFFLRGNHEIRNAYSIGLRALFDYVGDKTYGAFNWGDTRFVMLDCGEDKPDSTWVYYGLNDFTGLRKDQVSFLSKELNGKEFKQASKRVLLNHIPIYGNGDAYEPCPELWGSLLAKAPFNVNISAHTHQYAFHPKGSLGNNFPVIVGGGYKLDSATVMVLRKKGDEMSVQVLNAKGETLLDLKL